MKIAFLIGADGDTFVKPIIEYFRSLGWVCDTFGEGNWHSTLIENGHINPEYDLVWCEWATNLAMMASRSERYKTTKLLIRLHRYEAGLAYMQMILWKNVDCLLTVGNPVVCDVAAEVNPSMRESGGIMDYPFPRYRTIPNPVDLDKIPFQNKRTEKCAFIANIREVKNPMMMIECARRIMLDHKDFSFHIAGRIDDLWLHEAMIYNINTIETNGEEGRDPIYFDGWQSDIVSWLADKSYVICTSTIESQGMGNLMAMATGCIPMILDFPGARYIYPEECILRFCDFSYPDITWTPEQSRQWVAERYDSKILLPRYKKLIEDLV